MKLRSIFHFLLDNRQVGSTSLLEKVSKNEDITIVVSTVKEKFNEKCITLEDISNNSQNGKPRRPILFDNHAIVEIVEHADKKISRLEMDIFARQELDELFSNIRKDFEKSHHKKSFFENLNFTYSSFAKYIEQQYPISQEANFNNKRDSLKFKLF
jgi:hypothetical protein